MQHLNGGGEMSRKPRIAFPGAVYHVMNRGVDGRDIFIDDIDREKRTELLQTTVRNFNIDLFAYVFMDNHDHYFFRTLQANISAAIHYYNSTYCSWFNIRHQRSGVLFQSRFTDHLVEGIGYFREVSRYIHLNPVRAGLVEQPQHYHWSSYRGYCSRFERYDWIQYRQVLSEFGLDEEMAAKEYQKYVEQGITSSLSTPWEDAIGGAIIGSQEFAERIARELLEEELQTPTGLKPLQMPGLPEITKALEKITGEKIPDLEKLTRDNSQVRPVLSYLAKRLYGYSNKEIAQWLKLKSPSSVTRLVQRAEAEVEELEQICQMVKSII